MKDFTENKVRLEMEQVLKMVNQSLDIQYSQLEDWETGFKGSIEITNNTNNSESSVQGWDLDFDLPGEINDIWGANIVSSDNGDYTVESVDWNQEIRPGETVNVGFIGEGSGISPQNFSLEADGSEVPTEEKVPTGEIPTEGETPTEEEVPTVEIPTEGETLTVGDSPVTSSTSSLSLGEEYQGRATFFDASGVLGNSGYEPLTGSATTGISAINVAQWDGSEASGAFLEVSGPKQAAGADPLITQVVDLLPSRSDGLDLSAPGFEQVAEPVDGIVPIEYKLISPDDSFRTAYGYSIGDGIVAEGIDGTNPYYGAVRFNNQRHPIESVEVIEEDGERINLNRGSDNRFILEENLPISGVKDLEVTDIFGQEVILNDINLTAGAGSDLVTGEQFAQI